MKKLIITTICIMLIGALCFSVIAATRGGNKHIDSVTLDAPESNFNITVGENFTMTCYFETSGTGPTYYADMYVEYNNGSGWQNIGNEITTETNPINAAEYAPPGWNTQDFIIETEVKGTYDIRCQAESVVSGDVEVNVQGGVKEIEG